MFDNYQSPSTLESRTVASTVASTSSPLVGANPSRRLLRIYAPQTVGIWINPLGGTAAANGVDCVFIPAAGGPYTTSDSNAVTYFCGTAALVIPAFEA